ncbi:ABC transporter ATP-binding protein [Candidatus Saccharibacteria bacterium]|nr:ABC transporter ATP-binding protein [Candidatus Saccharibacteria bacterium]
MTKQSEKSKKIARRTLHYFWFAQKREKWKTLGTFLTTPLVILWRDVIFTYLMADIIAKVTEHPEIDFIQQNVLPEAILVIVLHLFFSAGMAELRIYCHWKMEINTIFYLQNMCFDTVAAQSMQFHNDRFSGSLVSQVNKFTSAYERLMDEIVWSILPVVVSITATVAVLFTRVPIYAAGLLMFVVIFIIISYHAFKKTAPFNQKMASAENKRTGQLADSISNIVSVKSYAKEKYEHERFKKYNGKVVKATNNLLHAQLKRNVMFDVVYCGITAIILVFLLTGQGVFGVTLGTLILVFNYSLSVTSYLWNFNNIFKSINRVFGDAEEMTEILDLADDVVDEPGAKALKVTDTAIDFKDITFKHKDAKTPLFTNFSLSVKPGERVGLVGTSGSGKTTLTKLLLRFADVNAGEIEIDGQNIRYVTQQSLREAIAYVPQETSLFHRTIAENIAYGHPDASRKEIERAAKLANVDEFVQELPDGYETLVGERVVKLSGGQRQRIAIARAILKNAPILVLDEATSALDSESEALIQSALRELMKGRTCIVIAHRLSTVAHLDRIVVLEHGKIAEQGTHAELLKSGGPYNKLWSRQSGAFLDEE